MERISRLELQIHPHVRKMIRENELTEHFITFMLSVYLAESKRAEYLELLMVQRHWTSRHMQIVLKWVEGVAIQENDA